MFHNESRKDRNNRELLMESVCVCACAELECATAQNSNTSQETVGKSPCTSQGHHRTYVDVLYM